MEEEFTYEYIDKDNRNKRFTSDNYKKRENAVEVNEREYKIYYRA